MVKQPFSKRKSRAPTKKSGGKNRILTAISVPIILTTLVLVAVALIPIYPWIMFVIYLAYNSYADSIYSSGLVILINVLIFVGFMLYMSNQPKNKTTNKKHISAGYRVIICIILLILAPFITAPLAVKLRAYEAPSRIGNYLEQKYNKKFHIENIYTSFSKSVTADVYPIDNPSLRFQASDIPSDNLVTTLNQMEYENQKLLNDSLRNISPNISADIGISDLGSKDEVFKGFSGMSRGISITLAEPFKVEQGPYYRDYMASAAQILLQQGYADIGFRYTVRQPRQPNAKDTFNCYVPPTAYLQPQVMFATFDDCTKIYNRLNKLL